MSETSPNHLLASIPTQVLALISPHLKLVDLRLGEVLAETDSVVELVYFPHSGAISLVVELDAGSAIETAMVGRDGVFNGSSALDGKISFNKGIVQLAGVASVIKVEQMSRLSDDNKIIRSLMIGHDQVMFAESQQSVACNARHLVEPRLSRWLLRSSDLAETDHLAITQEFLSQMLGVRRTSVTLAAMSLQKAGLIRYSRGHIRIMDKAGLQAVSCECYQIVKSQKERFLAKTLKAAVSG